MNYNAVKENYDVVVVGAGPSGLAAAISAARQGVKVALVDRNGYLGGNVHSNIPWLAFLNPECNKRVVGGIAQEIIERLEKKGACLGHSPCPIHISVTCIDAAAFEIELAGMVTEDGISCYLHTELLDAKVVNGKIESIYVVGKGKKYELCAKVFIDCTGDGDLGGLAGAGIEYGYANKGIVMPGSLVFMMDRVDVEECFKFIDKHPEYVKQHYPKRLEAVDGPIDGDFFRRNKSYVTYFLQEYVKQFHEKGDMRHYLPSIVFGSTPVKDRVYVLATRCLGVDVTDVRLISKAEIELRNELPAILEFLKEHIPGFENAVLHSVNPVMGFREGYRIDGIKRLTHENFTYEGKEDSVAVCSYMIDVHPQKKSSDDAENVPEELWLKEPYGIPYGCMVSKDIDCLMMAGRCISVDTVMLGSCRIIPTCFATGEAAGMGAALAVKQGVSPKDVDPKDVRESLRKANAIVSPEEAVPFIR